MTDWPEAVREYEKRRAFNDLTPPYLLKRADAAIAALKDALERSYALQEQALDEAEEAEAEVERLKEHAYALKKEAERAESDSRGWAESFKMAEQSIVDLQAEVERLDKRSGEMAGRRSLQRQRGAAA